MKNLKFGVIGAGALGLISIFLPWVKFGEASASLWKLRPLIGAGDFWIIVLGFAVPLAMGVMGVVKGPMQKWQCGTAAGFFALALFKVRDAFDLAIGAKLMMLAAVAGLAMSVVLIVKGEDG
jgi:hypothetical protein